MYVLPVNITHYDILNLKPTNFESCSCISYVKAVLSIQGSIGNAKDIQPTTNQPFVGAIVLLKDGFGHAGIVISHTDKEITITEANYFKCQVSERTLKRTDPKIRGYRRVIDFI